MALGLLWKPRGEQCSQWLRNTVREWRDSRRGSQMGVGHTGTLDPFAEGLLLFGVDEGTKVFPVLQGLPKMYRARFLFGKTSESFDTDSDLVSVPLNQVPSADDVSSFLLEQVQHAISQIPPRHSAVKVQGRKAHEWLSRGTEVDLAPRLVRVWKAHLMGYTWNDVAKELVIDLDLEVQAGTYVRALARDWGLSLTGQPGVCTSLKRMGIGPWRSDVFSGPRWLTGEDLNSLMDFVPVSSSDAEKIRRNGNPIHLGKSLRPRLVVNEATGQWVGLLNENSQWIRVFQKDPLDHSGLRAAP